MARFLFPVSAKHHRQVVRELKGHIDLLANDAGQARHALLQVDIEALAKAKAVYLETTAGKALGAAQSEIASLREQLRQFIEANGATPGSTIEEVYEPLHDDDPEMNDR